MRSFLLSEAAPVSSFRDSETARSTTTTNQSGRNKIRNMVVQRKSR